MTKFKDAYIRIMQKMLGLTRKQTVANYHFKRTDKNFHDTWDIINRLLQVLEKQWEEKGVTPETILRWKKYIVSGISKQEIYEWMEREALRLNYKSEETSQ